MKTAEDWIKQTGIPHAVKTDHGSAYSIVSLIEAVQEDARAQSPADVRGDILSMTDEEIWASKTKQECFAHGREFGRIMASFDKVEIRNAALGEALEVCGKGNKSAIEIRRGIRALMTNKPTTAGE